jgi:hypothetical protein
MPKRAAYAPGCQFRFERWQRPQQHCDIVVSDQQIWLSEEDERGAFCFLRRQNGTKIRVRRNDNAVFGKSPRENHFVPGGLHGIRSDVHRVVSGRNKQVGQKWRQGVID